MKLIYSATRAAVNVGDVISYVHHNDPEGTKPTKLRITDMQEPRHEGSTGRVYAEPVTRGKGAQRSFSSGSFPSVYGMEWDRSAK